MELHYHVLLPQKNFLDDLFLFRVGSGGEKENGEKNRRVFALGKGFGADAFVLLGWWSDRHLTAVIAKNDLATMAFSCRVR